MQFPADAVRDVARLLESANLGEISLESNGARLLVQREVFFAPAPAPLGATGEADQENPSESANPEKVPASTEETPKMVVVSNWVGVFRAAKKPIGQGESVKKKQLLGAVESLKVPFEVFAPADGILSAILVSDGQAIEWGQPLFEIESA